MGWLAAVLQRRCMSEQIPPLPGYCSSANCDRIADGRAGSGRRLDQRREVALLSRPAGILQCRTGAHNVADRQALRSAVRSPLACPMPTADTPLDTWEEPCTGALAIQSGDRLMAPDDPAATNEPGVGGATDSGQWIYNFKLYYIMLCINGCIAGVASRPSGGPRVPLMAGRFRISLSVDDTWE